MKQLCFMIISLIIISLVKAEKLKTELKTDKKAPIIKNAAMKIRMKNKKMYER